MTTAPALRPVRVLARSATRTLQPADVYPCEIGGGLRSGAAGWKHAHNAVGEE